MIYFCADDYGLSQETSLHIEKCIAEGALNKVSVFPNFEEIDLKKLLRNGPIRLSLHLNLVEGKCMADAEGLSLIADKNGNFINTFGGLLIKSLLNRKKFEDQIYREIREQVLWWKGVLPERVPFCIDSHQHTHMIPAIFRTLFRVLDDEKITPEYMRIPREPILPFIKTPSLYLTYSPINIIKQWLLKFLWVINKNKAKKYKFTKTLFFGILFSGKMDENRVKKLLPAYRKKAEKNGGDIEVLFHPGYLEKNELDFKNQNIVFEKFYVSPNRKTEFDSVMNIEERSVQ